VNKIYNSKFTTLGEIIDTAQPVLTKNGLAVSQMITNDEDRVGVETILMHRTGEFISSSCCVRIEPFSPETNKDGKVITQRPAVLAGSTISYLRRYGLLSILGMYSEEDSSENQGKKAPARSAPAPVSTPPPASAPEPQTTSRQSLTNGLPRPYMPAVLKEKIAARAKVKDDVPMSVTYERGQVDKLITGMFSSLYPNSVEKAKLTLLSYLTGKPAISQVSPEFILALLDWLEPVRGMPSAHAFTEAKAVWNMESK
jgi:hypothetical protein